MFSYVDAKWFSQVVHPGFLMSALQYEAYSGLACIRSVKLAV